MTEQLQITIPMGTTGWLLLIAFASISVASLALKRTVELRGPALVKASAILAVSAAGGAFIAAGIDPTWWATGAFAGTAAVEAGPAMLRLGVDFGRRLGRRFGGGDR
jgi:hypothetical protein